MKLHHGASALTRVRRRLFAFVTAVTLVAPLLLAGAMPVAAYTLTDPSASTITVDASSVTVDDTVHITVTLNQTGGAPVGGSEGTVTISSDFGLISNFVDHTDGTYTAELNSDAPGHANITAKIDSDAITGSGAVTADFAVGALSYFTVGVTDPQVAGAAFDVHSTAYDDKNNVKTDYTGTVDVSSNQTCSAGCVQTAEFTAGILASHSVTLTQAGTASEVGVVDHGGIYLTNPSGTSAGFVVHPAPLDHFGVTAAGGGAIPAQIAGSGFGVDITAYDEFGNVLDAGPNAYIGTVDVSSNRTCSVGCVQTGAFTAGVLGGHSVTLTQTGTDSVVKVVDHGGTYGTDPSGTSAAFEVGPFAVDPAPIDHFGVTPSTVTPTAGTGFTVDLTAYDAYGNVVGSGPNNYTGTKCITFSGPANSPNADKPIYPAAVSCGTGNSSIDFSNGSATGLSVTFYKAETVKLGVTDGSRTGLSDDLIVAPAALNSFAFNPIGTIDLVGPLRHVKAGTIFSVTATAYDQYGNVKTNYNSSPTITGAALDTSPACSTCTFGAKASSPLAGSTVAFAAGVKTFNVTSYSATIATDATTGGAYLTLTDGIASTSAHFTVQPEAVAVLDFSIPLAATDANAGFNGQPIATKKGTPIYSICDPSGLSTTPCIAGTSTPVKVIARDQFGNATPGVSISLTAPIQPGGSSLAGTTTASSGSNGVASFGSPTALTIAPSTATGTVRFRAAVTAGPSNDSNLFQIVDDLKACDGISCDNRSDHQTTITGALKALSGKPSPAFNQRAYGRITTGTDFYSPGSSNVLLTTRWLGRHDLDNKCGSNTSIGDPVDIQAQGQGLLTTAPNSLMVLVLPKETLQAFNITSRGVPSFNICLGALYLPGAGATAWQQKVTSPKKVLSLGPSIPDGDGRYWGTPADCPFPGLRVAPDPNPDPCILLRTKQVAEVRAILGTDATAALGIKDSDLVIIIKKPYPWDAKGSIF